MAESLVLRARYVLPITRAPIENGAVRISGDRIAAVGRWRDRTQRMNDDAVPRRLGLWLAQRAQIPLDDRTTPRSS